MAGRAAVATLRDYTQTLVATILFPLLWMRSLRFARERDEHDPRGPAKVTGAILLSVLLLAGGLFAVESFRQDAVESIYDNLENRLSLATGESEYQEHVGTAEAQQAQVVNAQEMLAQAQAAGDEANVTLWQQNLEQAQTARDEALAEAAALEGNHQLFLRVHQAIADRDDAEAQRLVAQSGATRDGMEERTVQAYAIKDDALGDMQQTYLWFVYPSLIGLFFAPLVWALGSVLQEGFEPSDTVGFKPYPSTAAALFLMLGAFGVPALFFAAWVFMDIGDRGREGQIAL